MCWADGQACAQHTSTTSDDSQAQKNLKDSNSLMGVRVDAAHVRQQAEANEGDVVVPNETARYRGLVVAPRPTYVEGADT